MRSSGPSDQRTGAISEAAPKFSSLLDRNGHRRARHGRLSHAAVRFGWWVVIQQHHDAIVLTLVENVSPR
jgi:hypothetical protein